MVQAFELGQVPPKVALQESWVAAWTELPGAAMNSKVRSMCCSNVDPDEKDTNNDASEALDKEKFPAEKFQSVAIINMAAT